MRTKKAKFASLLLVLGAAQTLTTMAQSPAASKPASANTARSVDQARWKAGYAKFPLSFEPCFAAICAGVGSQAKYFSHQSGYVLFLTSTEAILAGSSSKNATVRMKLLRSNSSAPIEGIDPLPGRSNYFIGKNPESWRHDVSSYGKVRYRNVYPGVDLVYYGNGNQLEYDFVVAAGADPRAIALTFPGARRVSVR